MKTIPSLVLLLFITISTSFKAYSNQDSLTIHLSEDSLAMFVEQMALLQEYNFEYDTGTIELGDNIGKLTVPDGYKFLNVEDSRKVLVDLWGNPPQTMEGSMGLIFVDTAGPFSDDSYVIEISYNEEGYISDEDVDDIDYDELLEEMQSDIKDANSQRVQLGYEEIELIDWASTPFYDKASKKLHWAKEIKFGEDSLHTLNYDIRVLGRKGYFQLNVISSMNQLERVQQDMPQFISSVNFNEGSTYFDFDPSIDKVAAVGIGGLIAGKALLKGGLIAKFVALFAKFWKFILIGLAGIGAGIKKFFTGKEKKEIAE